MPGLRNRPLGSRIDLGIVLGSVRAPGRVCVCVSGCLDVCDSVGRALDYLVLLLPSSLRHPTYLFLWLPVTIRRDGCCGLASRGLASDMTGPMAPLTGLIQTTRLRKFYERWPGLACFVPPRPGAGRGSRLCLVFTGALLFQEALVFDPLHHSAMRL